MIETVGCHHCGQRLSYDTEDHVERAIVTFKAIIHRTECGPPDLRIEAGNLLIQVEEIMMAVDAVEDDG